MAEIHSCPDMEFIERFVRGELEQGTQSSMLAHVEGCSACQKLVEVVRANEPFSSDWDGASSSPAWGSAGGTPISGYEILHEVHRGGQGVVFAAIQTSTKRSVAVKLLHMGAFAEPRHRRRFEREIDLAASLNHPNIVTVFDSGETETGELFLAMELVDGHPLNEHLDAHDLTIDQRLELFTKVCQAVHHAHQHGILHRDLKPGNILVDTDGEPRVVDFGLAKNLDVEAAGESFDTMPGVFVGTLAYSSPEQLQGRPEDVDVRSDVYGLGVILFQLLTGALPYDVSGTLVAVAMQIMGGEPRRPSAVDDSVGHELDAIVAKALEKRPKDRYQSVAELSADVENFLRGDPVLARSDSGLYVLRKRMRRHRLPLAALSLIFLSLVTATIVSSVFWRRSEADRERVTRERNHLQEVRDFQARMIAMANPYTDGHLVTVAELLDSAARDLAGEYEKQPDLRAELEMTVADSYAGLALYELAARHYAEAWALFRELRGEDDPVTIDARVGLVGARAHSEPGEQTHRDLVDMMGLCRELLGPDHRTTLLATTTLARLLQDQGKLAEAEALFRQNVEVQEPFEEERMDDFLTSLQNLAACYLTQVRYEEAEEIQRQVYEWRDRVLGSEHSATLTAANVLGQTWTYLGRHEEAEDLLRRTLDSRRRIYGDRSWVTCHSLNALGLCLMAGGEYEEAREVLTEAVATGKEVLPPHDVGLLRVQRSLGGALWKLERIDEALTVLRETYADLVEHHGPTHPDTIATQLGVGCALQAGKQPAAAVRTFEELLEACPETHPDRVAFLSQTKMFLGISLFQLGRPTEGEQRLLEALEDLEGELGVGHPGTQVALATLVTVYEQLGREEDAARYRARLTEATVNEMDTEPGDPR